jgi:hypothetical protein
MTVLLADGTTRTVNGDGFSIDDQGNLVVITSGGTSVAAFAQAHWVAVYVTGQVTS